MTDTSQLADFAALQALPVTMMEQSPETQARTVTNPEPRRREPANLLRKSRQVKGARCDAFSATPEPGPQCDVQAQRFD